MRIKKIMSCMFVLLLVLSMATTSYAAGHVPKRGACTRCETDNYSYGWNPKAKTSSIGRGSGNYCDYCKKIIPSGEYHSYFIESDLYYFLCKGSKCSHLDIPDQVYTLYFANPPIEHKIIYE